MCAGGIDGEGSAIRCFVGDDRFHAVATDEHLAADDAIAGVCEFLASAPAGDGQGGDDENPDDA